MGRLLRPAEAERMIVLLRQLAPPARMAQMRMGPPEQQMELARMPLDMMIMMTKRNLAGLSALHECNCR